MIQPPTGKVTFLFTDIEGSTSRWAEQSDEMGAALARHDAALRQAIEAHGGLLFKHTGDGVLAAFASPDEATAAAVEAQRSLDLPVRMGLATGEAEFRNDDYFGPTLNLAARVMSAGHGGQVLLAQTTATLVSDVDLLALGEHRLRGLTQPQRLYQVRGPSLRESFPPLRTSGSAQGNFPLQLTSFVGRQREIDDIARLVRLHRLVTITGPGGIGKTRLALQAALDLNQFDDGAWVVDLAPILDPEHVVGAIAVSLGVSEDPSRQPLDALLDYLNERTALLLLDNCEHLIVASAAAAHAILQSAPRIHILATSREALRTAGEVVVKVGPLSRPPLVDTYNATPRDLDGYEAVRLFMDRARSVEPGFSLTDKSAESVAQICSHLDGIPFAIELAAARLRTLTVDQIAVRLHDRFRLLSRGDRLALPRQRTLREAIDWSHQLLTDSEQTVFRRLAVFVGGWTLEAAAATVLGDNINGSDVEEILDGLVEKSLVAVENLGDQRYGFLETVRHYAVEKLREATEYKPTRDSHLQWCVAFSEDAASKIRKPAANDWFERISRESENIRAALEWALAEEGKAVELVQLVAALGWFWTRQGYHAHGTLWTDAALRGSVGSKSAHRASVLDSAGRLARLSRDFVKSRTHLQDALELSRELDATSVTVAALEGLGELDYVLGQPDEGREELLEALALNRNRPQDVQSSWWEVTILTWLGRVEDRAGREDDGERYSLQALEFARQKGLREASGAALNDLGEHARARAAWADATRYYEDALELARESGARGQAAFALLNLAYVARNTGDLDGAVRRISEVFDLEREIGLEFLVWCALSVLAGVLSVAGSPREGARCLGGAQANVERFDPADDREQSKDREALIRQLGVKDYDCEYADGAGLSIKEAREFALGHLRNLIRNPGPVDEPEFE